MIVSKKQLELLVIKAIENANTDTIIFSQLWIRNDSIKTRFRRPHDLANFLEQKHYIDMHGEDGQQLKFSGLTGCYVDITAMKCYKEELCL